MGIFKTRIKNDDSKSYPATLSPLTGSVVRRCGLCLRPGILVLTWKSPKNGRMVPSLSTHFLRPKKSLMRAPNAKKNSKNEMKPAIGSTWVAFKQGFLWILMVLDYERPMNWLGGWNPSRPSRKTWMTLEEQPFDQKCRFQRGRFILTIWSNYRNQHVYSRNHHVLSWTFLNLVQYMINCISLSLSIGLGSLPSHRDALYSRL